MSEQKKPKDISDLKARLGLKSGAGAAPAPVPGAAAPIPPPVIGAPPVVAPPVASRPGAGVVAPPPIAVPPPAIGMPGFGGPAAVPPPPFAKPTPPPGPDLSKNPFAVTAPTASPREVRLVIDEKVSVSEAETGRSRGMYKVITAAIAVATLGVGYCTGSTMLDRVIYNRSVLDGREIKTVVETSAKTLAGAQARVSQAVAMANTKKQADFETAQFLRSLKKPIDANAFHRRNYIKFQAATVDNLFEYYNGVNRLFDLFQIHAARTLADREALTKAPVLANTLATTDYGVVLSMQDNLFLANLVILGEPRMDGENLAGYEVRPAMGARGVDKTIYRGAELTSENFQEVVIPVNPAGKAGLLAENLSPFRDYLFRLNAMNVLLTELTQTQRQLLEQLTEISNLDTIFTFSD
ncbi:MAG: hypothetical protein HYY06_00885 [Deltaproteobacteria bacterium]|nr:hypothetical protein [Deltaproteobacteria bacterium]